MIDVILEERAHTHGWSLAKQVRVLCTYIEHQDSHDTFADFLRQVPEEDEKYARDCESTHSESEDLRSTP